MLKVTEQQQVVVIVVAGVAVRNRCSNNGGDGVAAVAQCRTGVGQGWRTKCPFCLV